MRSGAPQLASWRDLSLARQSKGQGRAGQAARALDMTQPEAKRNHPFDGWPSQGARPRRGQAGQVHSTLSLPPLGARLAFVVGRSGPMGRHTHCLTAAKYDCPGTNPLSLRGNTAFRLGCHGVLRPCLGHLGLMTAISVPFHRPLLQGTVQVILSLPICRVLPIFSRTYTCRPSHSVVATARRSFTICSAASWLRYSQQLLSTCLHARSSS